VTNSPHNRPQLLTAGTTLLIAAALFAGCGGSASGSPTAAVALPTASAPVAASVAPAGSSSIETSDACGIVTADAVSQASGFSVAASSGAGGICIFQNADKSKDLSIQVFSTQAAMALVLQIEPGGEHIANLGDDAFWVPQAGILFVRKGDHGIEILDADLGVDPSKTATRDALVALVKTALPRI
jgi:Protein of unknown function (DUF3558)